jgi:hypothetical protein
VTPMRSVPLSYTELSAAITAGAYPWERAWIDFKRRLYPDNPADQAGRARASLELAKDMASMAIHGGFLVYGVSEDKAKHLFRVDPMKLPVGLHETVDEVARSRITPQLLVSPTPVSDPGDTTQGFLVVEIPPSPDAPHMVEGTYWGRSETGKVRLTDAEVERLILARSRHASLLSTAMRDTATCDPVALPWRGCHFYFTAIPATGWVDMFADYSRDRSSRMRLGQLCTVLLNEIRSASGQRPTVAFSGLQNDWRSQRVAAGWLGSWTGAATDGNGRAVGVDDDGPVRYINLGPYGAVSVNNQVRYVHDWHLLFETRDMVQLVAALSDEVGYRGSWLLGIELDHLGGHMSQVNDPYMGGLILAPGLVWEKADYSWATTATALAIRQEGDTITGRLLRQLLRGLGTEPLLDQLPLARG